ncbi:MAG: sodium:solute symporter [Bryobacteraceae bacterium]
MWLGLSFVDWLIVITFLIGLAVTGVVLSARIKDETDFFMGGRRYGKTLMIFFSFASATSSEEAVSVTAGAWRAGLAGIWWAFLWLWATPFYWIVAPVLRRMRALTTGDFFEMRYNRSTATLYCLYGILILVSTMAGELYGSGKLLNALTGGELDRVAERVEFRVPVVKWKAADAALAVESRQLAGHEIAILVMTILFVAYGMAGGLAADIVTDFIQGILTVVFSFLLLPWIYFKIGGLTALRQHAELKPGMLDLFGSPDLARVFGTEPLTVFYVSMLALTGLVGVVVQPQIMSLCGAGKSEMEARWGFTYGHLIKRFCTIAWAFIGLGCVVWYLSPATSPLDRETRERLTPGHVAASNASHGTRAPYDEKLDRAFADELYGRVARDLLPAGLIGLLLVGSLAATMSSADTRMIASGGLFTEGIYKPYLAPNKSARHYLWTGRLASLTVVALSIVLQTTFTDVIDAVKFVVKTTAPIGISFWIGILWRGWTPSAVWVSSLTSYGVWMAGAHFPHWFAALGFAEPVVLADPGGLKVADSWTMFFYLTAGLVSGILASLVTRRTPQDKLDRFFLLLRTPARKGERVSAPCTLPADPPPPDERLFRHPDFEIPKPSATGITGFLLAWVFVALIAWLPFWLAKQF